MAELLKLKKLFPPSIIFPYGGSVIPDGWLLCDGTAVSRTVYADLFAAIGTDYGAGNGSTTFNLPDLRAAVPVGAGTSTGYTQNETIVKGTKYDDRVQGHVHAVVLAYGGAAGPYYYPTLGGTSNTLVPSWGQATTMFTDGTNGTPRIGNTTRGKQVGVNYIIKY